ncbi:hypothetical protein EDC96DRAFT_484268 [Choanephora cucurbitarum]|nr:hypothetical protein EDC96DRAFT_484268 [Choanephora cucurbitarum]
MTKRKNPFSHMLFKSDFKKVTKKNLAKIREDHNAESMENGREVLRQISEEREQKELAEQERKKKEEEDSLRNAIRLAGGEADFSNGYDHLDNDSNDCNCMGDDSEWEDITDDASPSQAAKNNQRWVQESDNVRDLYLKSFEINGRPAMSQTGVVFEASNCDCSNKRAIEITLYFMDAIKKVTLHHCRCNPLFEQLLLKQFMPASIITPRKAFHFGMLDFLHLLKMNGQISNHCFVNIANQNYGSSTIVRNHDAIKNQLLNSVYLKYRRLVRFAEDKVKKDNRLEESKKCLACENAERKLVSMDGNMQLKRRAAGREELPTERIFSLSSGELSLWGTKDEVDRADDMAKALKKDEVDCSVDISADNSFKAANNNNRNNSTGRYDQTGVFSLSCARHGVPERMYDIYGGEGHKYALACVGHMIKSNPNKKFGIMYDIACLVRKELENCYPTLKNYTWYGVTAFHAYAHTMACQVNYNPKYIPNFGYTDGEGCERFWSYLDGFVSMTRSMSSRNRLLAITDSVEHFTYQKMLELRKLFTVKLIFMCISSHHLL